MSNEATRTISEGDYYKLVGLLAVAEEHGRAIKIIARAAATVVGEDGDDGLAADAVYSGDRTAAELLDVLGIEVEHG